MWSGAHLEEDGPFLGIHGQLEPLCMGRRKSFNTVISPAASVSTSNPSGAAAGQRETLHQEGFDSLNPDKEPLPPQDGCAFILVWELYTF